MGPAGSSTTSTAASSSTASSSTAPGTTLIGVENVATPKWARRRSGETSVSLGKALRSLPAAVAMVSRVAWRTSPRLTV
ncbi:hypothetical protein K7G98_29475, partial [Saccharothrix sp. MB29]|nr:hypothetical protein [Saccharothrix sp. MB29]